MKHDLATQRQIASADPSASTWLSANAGSGKTRVLTDRVARLLLKGTPPQSILCLTYTKAAASEMQNRLFERLGEWSMLDDAELSLRLEKLGIEAPSNTLDNARTLFARAIDTPGGLRIQTIHSFCASLLRRFPLEARVSPMFREMDDRSSRMLREEILEEMSDGPQKRHVEAVARHYSGADFSSFLAEIAGRRAAFQTPADQDEIWRQFGLPPGFDENALCQQVFLGDEARLIDQLIPILRASEKVSDRTAAERLALIDLQNPTPESINQLVPIFLTGKKAASPYSAKIGAFPTKDVREANPQLMDHVNEFMARIEAAREPLNRLYSAQRTHVLHEFAARFVALYTARKEAMGLLDFDDLIGLTVQLLSDPHVAQWVLYRIDGGIDHLLVDEAQDTSPSQWRVIELLTQEFSAGQGARAEVERTIFVVGDLKQSIFSFQGADPAEFSSMKEKIAAKLSGAGQTLCEHSLDYSFRSSPAILEFVDATFAQAHYQGLGGISRHIAFNQDMPGRVDLWPLVPPADKEDEKEWFDPTDKLAANNPAVVLAQRIARHIEDLVKTGSIPDEKGGFRPIRFDDFLILVQRRSALFHEINRACKSRGLPMAGADRLKIGAELAVKDLLALLSFLAQPQDSLSLAAVLRSPLFGLSEAELFDLAYHRTDPNLWAALYSKREDFPKVVETLIDLRSQIDFRTPYDLLERILTRHRGREKILARLGPEAEEGLDALLSQAIAYEGVETPSIDGFLLWMSAADIEIKRQSDTSTGRIRIMTTHGAKGLEAPIVILPDCADWTPRTGGDILLGDDGFAMWRPPALNLSDPAKIAVDQSAEDQENERMRLLYVALTRAEKWLIACSAGKAREDGNSWYRRIEAGLLAVGGTPHPMPGGQGLRYQHGNWQAVAGAAGNDENAAPAPKQGIPHWATTQVRTPQPRPGPISPSDLPGAKSLTQDRALPDAQAALRGTRIHLLLEHLPNVAQSEWETAAAIILQTEGMDQEGVDDLLAEAARVLNAPEFADIFAPTSLAEVDVSAQLMEIDGQRLRGKIDRLVIYPEKVIVVDFKSNVQVPEAAQQIPTGILRQMGAYFGAIGQIYPDRAVELAVLWTHTATLMPVPNDLAQASLVAGDALDVGRAAT